MKNRCFITLVFSDHAIEKRVSFSLPPTCLSSSLLQNLACTNNCKTQLHPCFSVPSSSLTLFVTVVHLKFSVDFVHPHSKFELSGNRSTASLCRIFYCLSDFFLCGWFYTVSLPHLTSPHIFPIFCQLLMSDSFRLPGRYHKFIRPTLSHITYPTSLRPSLE